MEELEQILHEVKTHILSSPEDPLPVKAMAGGSVANTVRGLSAGFGISTGIVGAYGDDDQGQQFVYNMGFSGVDFSRMRKKKGLTGQVSLCSYETALFGFEEWFQFSVRCRRCACFILFWNMGQKSIFILLSQSMLSSCC